MMDRETLFLIATAVGLVMVFLAFLFRRKLPPWGFVLLILLGGGLAAAGLVVTLSFLAVQVWPIDD